MVRGVVEMIDQCVQVTNVTFGASVVTGAALGAVFGVIFPLTWAAICWVRETLEL